MSYVQGFLLAVPTANREAYIKMAQDAAVIFKEYGALAIMEAWGDDVPDGEVTSFPMATKCKPDETVVFSWMIWPSKEVCDAASKKAMEDPRMDPPEGVAPADFIPFDGKRMMWGGFVPIVEA